MLVDDYTMVVKGLDAVTEDSAKALLEPILEQTRTNLKAITADVWQAQDALNGVVLHPLLSTGLTGQPGRDHRQFQVSEASGGILTWIAEKEEPVWLDKIRDQSVQGYVLNNVTNQRIDEARYLDFHPSMNCLMGLPISYSQRLRGIIMIESPVSGQFNQADLESLKDLAAPTGILLWKLENYTANDRQTQEAIRAFRDSVSRATTRLNPYRTGFIARPFEPEFNSVGEKLTSIFLGHRIRAIQYLQPEGGGMVMQEMIAQVAAAHFGVVDISNLSPNVLVELGMIIGLGKPFLLFRQYDQGADLPFDLSGYHLYRYKAEGDQLRVSEPGQVELQPVEDVIKRFVEGTLSADDTFQRAREWIQ